MSKDIDIKVTGSGFLHPSDPKLNMALPHLSNQDLRRSTLALNAGLPWNVAAQQAKRAQGKKVVK